MGPSTLFGYESFSGRGRVEGAEPPSVNLGHPHNSETVRARKLKFDTPLERDNSTFRK